MIGFDPREHVYFAGASYEKIEGVIYARPEPMLGGGSDIEVLWSEGKWYAVFRRAWGDCPSGCIFSELSFFVEHKGDVKRIDPGARRGNRGSLPRSLRSAAGCTGPKGDSCQPTDLLCGSRRCCLSFTVYFESIFVILFEKVLPCGM